MWILTKWLNRRRDKVAQEARDIAGPAIAKMKAQLGYGYHYGGMSAGAKWPGGLAGSGNSIYLDHFQTRLNARSAYFDSSQAKAIVDRFADTVADTGLRLESTPMADILGFSQEEIEIWAQNVNRRFDLWARSKKQNRSESLTFYQSHHFYQIQQHRDNDIFVRLYYSNDSRLQNPLQYDFLDPNQIAGDALTTTYNTARFANDGIKRDSRGREQSYTVWVTKPNKPSDFKQVIIPRQFQNGRLRMLHGFSPVYPGQGRGYSGLAHALQEFQKLTDFTQAQIMKAITQSNLTMWVKPSKDDPASNFAVDLMTDNLAGPGGGIAGGTDPTDPTDETGNTLSWAPVPEATMEQPGSAVVANLQKGQELHTLDNTAPSDKFDSFVNAFTAHLSAASSMPVEVLLMKFGTNYSASRASLLMFWRVAQRWRDEMAADYLNPVYEMWLSGEIAAGRIQAPGWSDPRLRAAWLANRWIGAPMPNIDPKRTADADKTYVELGATTLDNLARDHNGSDGKANRAKLTREFQELPSPPWSQANGDQPDDDEKDENKDENN